MKNINYLEIKEILEKNLIEVYSNIDENETFESIKTISNSSNMDLTFFIIWIYSWLLSIKCWISTTTIVCAKRFVK